jgi:hypothetical protein
MICLHAALVGQEYVSHEHCIFLDMENEYDKNTNRILFV